MATQSVPPAQSRSNLPLATLFNGRRGRILRDNLTAYLFIAPASLIIFVFGIFPIFYASYVSLYKWRIRQGEYLGLKNYIDTLGDVAYVFFTLVALALIIMGVINLVRAFRTAQSKNVPFYFVLAALLPGGLMSYGLIQILLRFITFFSQQDAVDKGNAEILGNVPLGLAFIAAGIVISQLINRWQHRVVAKDIHTMLPTFGGTSLAILLPLIVASYLCRFTYAELLTSERYTLAIARSGTMVVGILILGAAYLLWNWAMTQFSAWKAVLGVLAAALFIGGGTYFTILWPSISQDSNPDFYRSLLVTIYFSIGAVPVQLGISMVLAYLLFQDIRGKSLFRVIFFIPYIAPTVATAGIFQVLFSLRDGSIANRIMSFLAGHQVVLSWLKEPKSAISVIGQAFGLETAVNWTAGPSLALVVIIAYGVWVFIGYNTVVFLAGLGNIPGELYEAAEIDGAGRWSLFRHITLPLLSPITFFLSVLSLIGTFKSFTHIWILRDSAALGSVDTVSVLFFQEFFRGSRFSTATSMAMVLFVIILAITIIQNRIAERSVFYG